MSYLLSVDLGTTFSAAAIAEGGEPRIVSLGSRTATIPSVVALRPDGTVLIGEAAERRAITDPTRVAREFKRRLGDPVSTIIGGTPYGAEMLMAHLLRGIADQVAEQLGEPPARIVLSHPANYGPYKLDLLEQVGHLAEVEDVEFITEPQAAAVHYSEGERIEPGEVVAVYDLGGGTFDAALVQRADRGFELLGTPDGLERFGGIDLDEAVFMHVRRALGGAIDGLDPVDPAVVSALARLREDCRLAKEGLSSDTDAAIPVMLPNLHTEVRLVRSEFEDMIRPRLRETIATLERVVRSAGLAFQTLSRVLLVGGSSRIPLVAEMVREATGRPVGLDAHPKHAIALGAATAGLAGATRRTARAEPMPPVGREVVPEKVPEVESVGAPGEMAERERPEQVPAEPVEAVGPVISPESERVAAPAGEREPAEIRRQPRKPRRRWVIAGAVGLIGIAAAATLAIVLTRGGSTAPGTTQGAIESTTTVAAITTEAAAVTTTTVADGGTSEAPAGYPPVEGAAPAPDVLAIYMTNYVRPGDGEDWGAWASGGEGRPPEDIASDFYPALGPYDVRDPAIVAQHLAWMRQAGIGTVAVMWAGLGSPGEAAMPTLLEMAARYEISFVLVFPPSADVTPESLEVLATEGKSLYGESPQWLRLAGPGTDEALPVVLLRLPEGMVVDPGAWREVFDRLGLTVVVESPDLVWVEAGADGLMFSDVDRSYGWASGLPDGVLYVPMVSPGFSEEWVGGSDVLVDRRGGELYRENWELAHAPRQPSLVVIDSFNRWTDGSQIEPALQDAPERPDHPYSTYAPLTAEGYLQLTREMVGQP